MELSKRTRVVVSKTRGRYIPAELTRVLRFFHYGFTINRNERETIVPRARSHRVETIRGFFEGEEKKYKKKRSRGGKTSLTTRLCEKSPEENSLDQHILCIPIASLFFFFSFFLRPSNLR